LAIGVTAVALVAAGCSQAPSTEEPESGGELRIYASEPAFLLPPSADDDPSIQVIRQLYRGLVTYNTETGKDELDLAESIESDDATTWTITIKQGYTFTNGEPVDADAFIRSWNYAAYGPNAQNNAYFMSKIAGIDEVSGEEPEAEELSGLTKTGDYTLEVELVEPFAAFPATIGYSGFFPIAQACLDDMDACNETPIGNGPYKIEGAWEHDEQIVLVRNDDWAGDKKGVADKLIFTIYEDVDAGYAAFGAGDLDVMYTIPPAEFKNAQEELGDRLYTRASNSFTYLGFPLYDPQFEDVRLRQAFSMAIDRQAIIDAVFNGRFFPAQGVVSPNFDGYRPNACEYCKYDPDAAKALFDEAGGFDGTLHLWANAGAGHDAWLQAVGDQLSEELGITYELHVSLEFPEYLETADNNGFTGPFRLGWGPDYPVLETYLGPLYTTGGSSNNSRYSNEDFDDLIAEANGADSTEDAIALYQEAEDIIVEDLPVIPMWFGQVAAAYADTVDSFLYNPISGVSYGEIVLK